MPRGDQTNQGGQVEPLPPILGRLPLIRGGDVRGNLTTIGVKVKKESEGGDDEIAGKAPPPPRPFSKIRLAVPACCTYWYIYRAFFKRTCLLRATE